MSAYRIKRSVNLDPDMAAWIKEQAKRFSTSENTIIRQALRAAMPPPTAVLPPAALDGQDAGQGRE